MNRAELEARMPWAVDLGRRLPDPVFDIARRVTHRASVGVRTPFRWGSLRRLEPINHHYGYGRGTPIDRYYLQQFMAASAGAFTGRILELQNDEWSSQFAAVGSAVEILDIDPTNDAATMIADLDEPGSLPPESFDCIVLPQTMQYVADPVAVLANLRQSCRPGATLLMSVPTISKLDATCGIDGDLRRLTPAGLASLLARAVPEASATVRGYGNVLAATGFLHGISAEELSRDELDTVDRQFPILACASVTL